jgi:hypothetical protein
MFVFGCMCQGGTRIEPEALRSNRPRSANNAPRAPIGVYRKKHERLQFISDIIET